MDAPDTRIKIPPNAVNALREKIRGLGTRTTTVGGHTPATPQDAEALYDLLKDDRVSGPLYTIPKPVTRAWVATWIDQHLQEQQDGVGALLITHMKNDPSQISGFSDLQFWPDYAAAEMGCAVRPKDQNQHRGTQGAAHLFDWLFDDMDIELLAMTCAPDNMRTQKLLTHLGFTRGADRISHGPDGTTRPSYYWELRKENRVKF